MKSSTYRNNISTYYNPVSMPGGYIFDTAKTLKTIELYLNGRFESGAYDNNGLRKFFYNITKPACDVATKFIDLDTKDVILNPEPGSDEFYVAMKQRHFKQWMKENKFGVLLNEIAEAYPKGTVFIKKFKGNKYAITPTVNMRFDPSANSLNDSPFVYEVLQMSAYEMEDMGWDLSSIDQLKNRLDVPYYLVYECYQRTRDGWDRTFVSGLYDKLKGGQVIKGAEAQINSKDEEYAGEIVLHSDTVKKLPYRELYWEKVNGRLLGKGFPEYLFDNQIAENEAENLERRGLIFKALQVWQTKDEGTPDNLLTDIENGAVIKTIDELRPVQKDNSDLIAFKSTRDRWQLNSDKKTFSFDIATGANLPSRTPLGVANMQASMVSSYFDLKRENFGLFIKYLILEDILPEFDKEFATKDFKMTILGSDNEIGNIDSEITNRAAATSRSKYMSDTGFAPEESDDMAMMDGIKRQLKANKNRYIKIGAGSYKGMDHTVDVITTGEQIDTGSIKQTLMVVVQMIGSNPAIITTEPMRSIIFKMLELSGISPADIQMLKEKETTIPQQPMPQGGSVAMPQNVTPSQIPTSQQI
jgi:hypothetical protein